MRSLEDLAQFPLRSRAAFGLQAGGRLGAYFAILTAVIAVLIGKTQGQRLAIPLALAVFLGLLASGVIFGVARPWVRDSYGAALLGTASLAPVLLAALIASRGVMVLVGSAPLAVGAAALLIGGLLGSMFWRGWLRRA